MTTTLRDRARLYLRKCPPAISGQGGHKAAFRAACAVVRRFGLSEAESLTLLQEFNQRCLPPWSEPELRHKVQSAAKAVHPQPQDYLSAHQGRLLVPAKPKFRPMVLKRIANKVSAIQDVVGFLAKQSPVPVDWQDSSSVLRQLYGAGEKVLIFSNLKSQGQLLWDANQSDDLQPQLLPTGPEGVWFLPQPVRGGFYPNPRANGKSSRRSEEAVTAWRFAVLESDEADADDWLRCLVQMPLRIASICESGRRSIHALVRVDAASKAEWDRLVAPIKPVLITLGADPGALSAVRLSRLPQAMRGERCQRLLYLNSQPSGMAICKQPPGYIRN
jgi:hypothetical protein